MDNTIRITELNDYVFCPASIYFHSLYGSMDTMLLQCSDQINGSNAHETIDNNTYSTSVDIITGMDIYCEEFDLIGKIDIYDRKKKLLRERKKHIAQIYDGYVYQLYACGECDTTTSEKYLRILDFRHFDRFFQFSQSDRKGKKKAISDGVNVSVVLDMVSGNTCK